MRQARPRWASSAALLSRLWVAVAIKSKGGPIPAAMGPTTGMFGKWVMHPGRWPEQFWSALGRDETPVARYGQRAIPVPCTSPISSMVAIITPS